MEENKDEHLSTDGEISLNSSIDKSLVAEDVGPLSVANIEASDVQFISENSIDEFSFAKAGLKKQPDLLYVKFKLAHVGANKNRDGFEESELRAAEKTPIMKLIDWEHEEPVIGTIYHSEYKNGENKAEASEKDRKGHIEVEGVIWKVKYPNLAKKMLERHAVNDLKFSMEALFSEAACSSCGQVFASKDHPSEDGYCDCLKSRGDENYVDASGNRPVRLLRKFVFSGAGVVGTPADQDATSIAVAKNENSDREEDYMSDKLEMTKQEFDDAVAAAVKDALDNAAANADLEGLREKVSELTSSVSSLTSELDETKTALSEATEKISTLTEERDAVAKEFSDYKENLETEAAKAERVSQLTEAGFIFPEDEDERAEKELMFVNMSDEVFAFTVQTIQSSNVKEEKEEEKEEEKVVATAGEKVPAGKSGGLNSTKLSDAQVAGEAVATLLI